MPPNTLSETPRVKQQQQQQQQQQQTETEEEQKEDDASVFSVNFKGLGRPSTLGFKYPTLRDHPLHSYELWLAGKRCDDGADGLWRIHDGLYDFTDFIHRHPGGSDWLNLTKGTDITELFESHHLSNAPSHLLSKFYIRNAPQPRNSPFTFEEDGFYKTLKRNVTKVLKDAPTWPKTRSKIITDCLLGFYLVFAFGAVYFWSFTLGIFAGLFLTCTAIAAHNYFHQMDNFRMYYFDLCMMSSKSWRVSHVMSHHMYTNTVKDLEISTVEPWLQYLPGEKPIFFRYLSWFYSPIMYSVIYFGEWIRMMLQCALKGTGFSVTQILPFLPALGICFMTGCGLPWVALMYGWIFTVASVHFGVVGLNAAHHHPDIFHDGDAPRPKAEMDWGIYQMDAVMDRSEITGSHILVLTNFGDHALHHLFPTVDHGLLEYLYPTFKSTCEQFGVDFRMSSQLQLISGQFRQLSKVRPKSTPPKPLKKIIAGN